MGSLSQRHLNPFFWKGKSVFLTGHTGFKGSWLAYWLINMQAEVTGFSLEPHTQPNLFEALELEKSLGHLVGDIREKDTLTTAIRKCDPDIIIHMAAQPIVSEGYENPSETFDTNIMGVVHLFEACRTTTREIPILVISSDKCYLNDDTGTAFSINAPLGGKDPYSASKAGTEIIASAYMQSYFNREGTPRVATARAGNVIGGGDWSNNRLIPDAAINFSTKSEMELRNPLAVRPWQHVLEPLYGYLILIEAMSEDLKFAKAWNFGPNSENTHSVKDVMDRFANCWGPECRFKFSETSQEWSEAATLGLDCSETIKALQWRPALDLDTSLKWTAEWYKSFYSETSSASVQSITSQQIKRYVDIQNNSS